MNLLSSLLLVERTDTYKLKRNASPADIKKFRKDLAFTQRRTLSPGMIPLILRALQKGIVTNFVVIPPVAGNRNAGFNFKFKGGTFDEQDVVVIQKKLKAALGKEGPNKSPPARKKLEAEIKDFSRKWELIVQEAGEEDAKLEFKKLVELGKKIGARVPNKFPDGSRIQ